MKINISKQYLTVLLIYAICFQFACSANRYRQPISNFQAASALVTANARSSLSEVNRLEISRVITEKRLKGEIIYGNDIENAKKISFDDLQARLDALDRINEYADLLVKIANSDAPDNIAKSAANLSVALGNLSSTVNKLTVNSNTNFKSAFSLAGTAMSEVLRFLIQKRIKEALDSAILKGDKPINDLIDVIGINLAAAYKTNEVGLKQLETALIGKYQVEASKPSPNENMLETLSTKIIANRNAIELLQFANPKDALDAMKKAHSKIVMLAKTNTPANFSDAVDSIEAFVAAAKRLGDAVQELRKQNV